MNITPDEIVYFQWKFITLSATIVYTWAVMAALVISAWLATRNLSVEPEISRKQHFLESLVSFIRDQIEDIVEQNPMPFLPFLGTLFLYISISNLLSFVPGYQPPTGSINTTAALALCVFFAVPIYGIGQQGIKNYLKLYIRPTMLMLPFNIIGELSRTLALAVRLFGNVMSGTLIVAVLVSIAPLIFPILLQALDLIIGQIQAYIFAVLAAVYIASATRVRREEENKESKNEQKGEESNG